MPARKLLRPHRAGDAEHHVLSADDARVVVRREILRGSVGEPLVQVRGDAPVANELLHSSAEISDRHVEVPHEVNGETVIREDDQKEHEVHEQVQQIREELEVKHHGALALPRAVEPAVDDVDDVLGRRRRDSRRQDYVLESEEEEHARAVLQRVRDRVVQERGVDGHERDHEDADPEMREARRGRRRLDVRDAIGAEPVKDLDEEQRREQDDEPDVELLSEDGHREARLHDGVFDAVVQSLHLGLAKRPQEHRLEEMPQDEGQREREIPEHDDGELGRAQVQHRGEVLLARLHRVVHEPAGDGEGADDVLRERHRVLSPGDVARDGSGRARAPRAPN
eukprot:16994-Pelagococcus_subviridis.AAC.2